MNDIANNNDEKSSNDKITTFVDNLGCCGQIITLFFALGFVVAYIILIIYDIFALKTDSTNDVHNICSRSNLWEFLFISVIMIPINHIIAFVFKDIKIQLTIPISLLLWGSLEFFGIKCVTDLDHMDIYHMALIHLILGYVCIPLVIFIDYIKN
jgi:hypothetical protein